MLHLLANAGLLRHTENLTVLNSHHTSYNLIKENTVGNIDIELTSETINLFKTCW
jgi:hypothetical protein